ncbi:MAG: rubrerythrin family protein [Deltaproteobacteria bacterium]|nr:rubrerythrin family protein [Deltaproteobacteria bacterium]
MEISDKLREKLLKLQKSEITAHHIYKKLAGRVRLVVNRRLLEQIAEEKRKHYDTWKSYTNQDVEPDERSIRYYGWISRALGFTFGAKLVEHGENRLQAVCEEMARELPEAGSILEEERKHEFILLQMLDEERLQYRGDVAQRLTDAMAGLGGVLAGLTPVLHNSRLIALTGIISSVSAALLTTCSACLATRAENGIRRSLRTTAATGALCLVLALIPVLPYLLFRGPGLCLTLALAETLGIIALLNFYISVVKNESFKRHFMEKAGLGTAVAVLSFLAGFALRAMLGKLI